MAQPTRVLFLIPHLGGGGAERVTALLATGISPQRFEVHLGIVTRFGLQSEPIPASVAVHTLGATRVRAAALRVLRLVSEVRPHVIVSGMAHLNFLVMLLRPLFRGSPRVILRQNTTVSAVLQQGHEPFWTAWLYRLLYPDAHRILCQSTAMAADLAAVLPVQAEQIAVLPNPVDLGRIRSGDAGPRLWNGPGPHLLAVGRLAPEKGFDLLLAALAVVRRDFPATDLTIVGNGAEESALKAQARQHGLEGCVRFAGSVENPCVYFPGASAFVLSSRYEGMPNALLEAGIAGLPLVALPCSGGVIDLLREWSGSWLASDASVEALAQTLTAALREMQREQRFQRTWDCDRAIRTYEDLIEAAITEPRP